MKLLSAKTAGLNLCSVQESKHSTLKRGSTTSLCDARSAKMRKRLVWMAAVVEEAVEDLAELVCATRLDEENALEVAPADSHMMVAAVVVAVAVEEVVVEGEEGVVVASAMPFRGENATGVMSADSLTK